MMCPELASMLTRLLNGVQVHPGNAAILACSHGRRLNLISAVVT